MRFLCLAASIPPELGIPSLNHFRGSIKADVQELDAPFCQESRIYSHAAHFYLAAKDNYLQIVKGYIFRIYEYPPITECDRLSLCVGNSTFLIGSYWESIRMQNPSNERP